MIEPPKPMIGGSIGRWVNWIHQEIKALRVASVSGMEIRRGSNGVQLIATPGAAQQVTQTSGLAFKGEYVAGASYSKNDIVVIYTGSSRGTYICVQTRIGTDPDTNAPVPQSDPQHGNYWISFVPAAIETWT